MNSLKNQVTQYLDAQGILYEVRVHGEPVFTCEDAARERNVAVSQILKCMVGIDGEDHIYVMLIPGDKVLKIKRVRQLTNGIRIDLADRDVISKTLGLTVGALSPIQLIGKAKRFFMDNHVFREERVAMSSGDPNSGILLNPHSLAETLQATTCDIVSVR